MPSKEVIESITEVRDFSRKGETFDGFCIKTSKQEIFLGISNYEIYGTEGSGYFLSEDDLDEFVGSRLLDVTLTNTEKYTRRLEEFIEFPKYTRIMFVNLETDQGTLQFTVYNENDGFYGHTVLIQSSQLFRSQEL